MDKSLQQRLTNHMNLGDIMRWHEHQDLLKETIAYIDKLEEVLDGRGNRGSLGKRWNTYVIRDNESDKKR